MIMKNLDYQTPMCVEFHLMNEGFLCASAENEGFTGSDYNDEWLGNN